MSSASQPLGKLEHGYVFSGPGLRAMMCEGLVFSERGVGDKLKGSPRTERLRCPMYATGHQSGPQRLWSLSSPETCVKTRVGTRDKK
jgi:hypothetical protein